MVRMLGYCCFAFAVVDGGAALQPVLYALAVEKLFPGQTVESGRLYYCTAAGGFAERTVPLDAAAKAAGSSLRSPTRSWPRSVESPTPRSGS